MGLDSIGSIFEHGISPLFVKAGDYFVLLLRIPPEWESWIPGYPVSKWSCLLPSPFKFNRLAALGQYSKQSKRFLFGWYQTRGAQKGAGARMLHNLRSSCETELMERFPVHVVSKWLGHDTAIALKHNSQTTDEHFAEALGKGGAESGARVAQKPGKKIVASRSNQLATMDTNTDGIKAYAVRCDYFRDNTDLKAEGEGFEPTDALRHLRFSRPVH